MASPFHFFRKYQKVFLVLAGVMAMFVFVFADLFTSMVQDQGGGSSDTVVTSWDGGQLTAQELNSLYQRRLFLHDFLSNLSQLGMVRVQSEGGTPAMPTVPSFLLNQNVRPVNVMDSCVRERILADQAREVGMAISNDMVNHYLREFGSRKIGDQDIKNILQQIRRIDLRTGEEMLFSGLRELLLGHLYVTSVTGSTRSVPPEQLWEDWLKVNDRIALEAVSLPNEAFISAAPEPSEGQLISFYEQYKDQLSDVRMNVGGNLMASPNPGFRAPRKVKTKYLLGDVTAWTQEMLPTVTDEEIADYYERNKRTQFVKLASDIVAAENTDAEETAAEDASEAPADDEAASDDETASGDDSSTDREDTATTEEEAPPAEGETPATDAAAVETAVETESESSTASDEDVEQKVEEEEEEEELEEEDAQENSEETEAETEAEAEATETEETETEEDVEYEPLEEVSEDIRRLLANDKAVLELKGVMEGAFGNLTTAYNRYGGELIEADAEEGDKPPVPASLADLSTLAKEMKLLSEETVPLSMRGLSETGVGKAVDAQTGRRNVTQACFGDLKLYEPLLAQDLDGYWYLVLKVEDTPSLIPELEEIRDEVVAAWKRNEAAKLALAKGEALAKEAQESGKSLEAFFTDSDHEVTVTDLFSWYSFGNTPANMQPQLRLGDAPPLTAVGTAFMEKAFDLKPEDVISLVNFDHSNAYVLKLATRERTEKELRTAFLSEVNNSHIVRSLYQARVQEAYRNVNSRILDRVNLDRQSLQSYLQAVSARSR